MASHALSGRYGAIGTGAPGGAGDTAASTIRNWQASVMNETKEFAASNTKAGAGRRQGINDWSGNFGQYGGRPILMPGVIKHFTGYPGPTTPPGTVGTPGECWKGDFILESLSTVWNWENNDIVQTTYNMQGYGPLTHAPGIMQDSSAPVTVPSSVCVPVISVAGGSAITGLCWQSANLNVLNKLQTYADSCTGSWRSRAPGTIDWNLSLVCDEPDVSLLGGILNPAGAFLDITLPVDTATNPNWVLKYGIVTGINNYNVDIESGAIINYTINISMSFDNGNGTIGSITPPGTTTPYWPAAGAFLREAEEEMALAE